MRKSPLLLSIDIAPGAHPDLATAWPSRTSQDARQIIVIHQIAWPHATILLSLLNVFFLILSENKALSPAVLASSLDIGRLAAGCAVCRFGDAVNVATLVELEVLLQVESCVAGGIGRARDSCQGGLSAARAKLLGRVFANKIAAVASKDPGLQERDAGQSSIQQAATGQYMSLTVGVLLLTSDLSSRQRYAWPYRP